MGFFPFSDGSIDRTTLASERKIHARVFCVIDRKYYTKDFEWNDVDAACAWIAEKMKQVEM